MKITFYAPSDFVEIKDSIEKDGSRKEVEIYEDGTVIETTIHKNGTKTIYSNRMSAITQNGSDLEIHISNVPEN